MPCLVRHSGRGSARSLQPHCSVVSYVKSMTEKATAVDGSQQTGVWNPEGTAEKVLPTPQPNAPHPASNDQNFEPTQHAGASVSVQPPTGNQPLHIALSPATTTSFEPSLSLPTESKGETEGVLRKGKDTAEAETAVKTAPMASTLVEEPSPLTPHANNAGESLAAKTVQPSSQTNAVNDKSSSCPEQTEAFKHTEVSPSNVAKRNAYSATAGSPASGSAPASGETSPGTCQYSTAMKQTEGADTPSHPTSRKGLFVRFGPATIRELSDRTLSRLERTLTPRTMVLSIFVTLTACIVLLLIVALWPESAHSALEPCTSAMCRQALKYLDDASNPKVAPCDDFYGYVCYKWMKKNSFLGDCLQDLYDTVNSTLFMSVAARPDRYGMKTFRSLYRVCYEFMHSEQSVLRDLMDIFEEESVILQMWNTSELVLMLMEFSIARGIDSIFQMNFVMKEERRLLSMSYGHPLLERLGEKTVESNLTSYVTQILDNIPHPTSNKSDVTQRVLELDATMRQILIEDQQHTAVVTVDHLALLSEHLETEDWLVRLKSLLEDAATVRSTDPLITRGFNATVKMLSALDLANPDARLNYLFILTTAEVLKFDYHRQYGPREGVIRACLTAGQNVFTHTWSHLIARLSATALEVPETAELFTSVANKLWEDSYIKWMDNTTMEHTTALLRNVPLKAFSVVPKPLPSAVEYLNIAFDFRNDFPRSYLALLAKDRKIQLRVPPDVTHSVLNRAQLNGVISYLESIATLVIPTASSRPPMLYPRGIPAYFNYGTVGALVAKELSNEIGPYPRGKRNLWWTNSTYKSIAQSMECLQRQHSSRWRVPLSNQEIHAQFAWTRSVRVAYDAMEQLRTSNATYVPRRDSHWDDARRTFFRRFCLLSCGAASEPLTARVLCTLPLMNMPEFASAFGCAAGRAMAPLMWCPVL